VDDAAPGDAPADNVTTLGWTAFWSGMAQEMIYPLLPIFMIVSLSSSKTALGAVEGLLGVGITVARLYTGRAMDRGASPLRLTRWSYGLSLVARPLMALAPGVAVVGALRVVDGLGKGGKDAPKAVLVAADADQARMGRSFGIQTLLDTLGSVAGPVVAGLVLLAFGNGDTGLRVCFALAAIPALGAVRQLARAHDAPVVGATARSRASRSEGRSTSCSRRCCSSAWRTRATRCCCCGRAQPASPRPIWRSCSPPSTSSMLCWRFPWAPCRTAWAGARCCSWPGRST
jgi:MFS family permease